MKRKIRSLSLLAAMTIAGGAMASLQAKAVNAEVYDVNFTLQNTNLICAVYGLPSVDSSIVSVDVLDYSVSVDAAGKITGFAEVQLSAEGGTAVTMAKVTGKMGMKGTVPAVNMTFKATGFSSYGSTSANSKGSLKFTGTPVYVGSDSYYSDYEMDGKVNATFNTGIKGAKTINIKNASGTINSYDVAGMTQIDSCILSMVVVNNKLALGGCLRPGDGNLDFHYEWNGTGSVNQNSGKFNFTLTGTGGMAGARLSFKGIGEPVNPTASIGDVNLKGITATGKVMGQTVKASGSGNLTVQTGE